MKSEETLYAYIKIENSILTFVYKPLDLLDADTAEVCIKDRLKFSENKPYPVLVDIRGVKGFTSEARDLIAKKGNKSISAVGILVKSPVERMIANTYIGISKRDKPMRMFTNEKRALVWLSRFKEPT